MSSVTSVCPCCGDHRCSCPLSCSCRQVGGSCYRKREYKSASVRLLELSKLAAGRCWKGYEPVPGKQPYSNDSCRPVGSKPKDKKSKPSEKKASPAWQRSEGKNPEGGLNEKGRKSLKAQGHDIKRPQPEGGPRKDSFCARMKGMKAKRTSKETARDPDSRINKSLRKWKCGSAAEKLASLLPMQTGFKFPSMPQPKPESWKSRAAGWGGQRVGKQYGAQLGNMAGSMASTLGKPLGVTPDQANQFGQAVGNFASPVLGNIGSFVGSNAQRYNVPLPGMPSILK